jgi:hypothetical protein
MDIITDKSIVDHIHSWINYVSNTNTSNGFAICPHAAKVLKDKRLQIFKYDPKLVDNLVDEFRADITTFKVWILLCDNPKQQCQDLNNIYQDIVWLYDLAEESGMIDGTVTGNQKFNIILMQDKEELNKMSKILDKLGYYTNWSGSYYDQIVSWRKCDQS